MLSVSSLTLARRQILICVMNVLIIKSAGLYLVTTIQTLTANVMNTRTEEILARFSASWTKTEAHYDDLINNYHGWDRVIPIRSYISKLKQEGEDKFFRLGTSLDSLMISRSVEFGLRPDQKYIKIEALDVYDFKITLQDGSKVYRAYKVTTLENSQLEKLLVTLKSTLVD